MKLPTSRAVTCRVLVVAAIVCAALPALSAQRRIIDEVVSNDLVAKRPRARKPATRPAPKYAPTDAAGASDQAEPASQDAIVGVTLWRLARSRGLEQDEAQLLVADSPGAKVAYTPFRSTLSAPVREGDLVRLSIESPRTGYMYVVDRERYADGTFGKPMLIFPTTRTRGGNNAVRAGVVVEIPAQNDATPYFRVTRSRPDLAGDVLTVVVTAKPIRGLKLQRNKSELSEEQFSAWLQAAQPAERYELDGGVGAAYTPREKQAGAAAESRLTQDDPLPQTVYRLRMRGDAPVVLNIPLDIAQGES